MKKTLLGLTAMALFFAACKKDDDSPATYYLSKIIEVGEDGNDTSFISYNADNTFKELSYSYTSNGEHTTHSEGPVYEGGKIVSIRETNDGAVKTTRSVVYTGGVITRIVYHGDLNGDGVEDQNDQRYDSLVYTAGKLTELHAVSPYSSSKYILTWEGNNVKTSTTYYAQSGSDYVLDHISKYTYDNKPGFQQLLGSYQWLNEPTSFEYLSANNLTREEFFRDAVVRATYTNTYTYEGNLLVMVDSEDTWVDPPSTDTYKVKLEYTAR